MASTFADVIADTEQHLSAYGTLQDGLTSLKTDIGLTDLAFEVQDPSVVQGGFIEVDDEIISVKGSPAGSGVVVFPWGRGSHGTKAAAHTAGTKVSVNSLIPRSRLKNAINETVLALFPDLFAVRTYETTANPSLIGYQLPADAVSIMGISVRTLGATVSYWPVNRFKMINDPDVAVFTTGKSVEIYEPMPPGQVVKIIYRAAFSPFVNETDTLVGLGLQEGWRDIIRLGAMARVLPSFDIISMQNRTMEAAGFSVAKQGTPFPALNISKFMLQQQQSRIASERRQLLNSHPSTQIFNN